MTLYKKRSSAKKKKKKKKKKKVRKFKSVWYKLNGSGSFLCVYYTILQKLGTGTTYPSKNIDKEISAFAVLT